MQANQSWREKILKQFLGKLDRFWILVTGIRGFHLADLFAKMAGFFTAERIDDRFRNGCLLGVGDQHVRPCIELHHGVGSTDHVDTAEDDEQVLEESFQVEEMC